MDKEKALKLIEWMKGTNIEVYTTLLGDFEVPGVAGKGTNTDDELAEYLVELHSKHSWVFDSILSRAGLDSDNSSTEEK